MNLERASLTDRLAAGVARTRADRVDRMLEGLRGAEVNALLLGMPELASIIYQTRKAAIRGAFGPAGGER
jgi:hypothetical protein